MALRPGAHGLDGRVQRQQLDLECDEAARGYGARDIRDLLSTPSANRLELGIMESFEGRRLTAGRCGVNGRCTLAGVRLVIPDHARGLPLCTCCRPLPRRSDWASCLLTHPVVSAFPGGFSVTVCEDKAGTDESVQKAMDWIAKNAGNMGVAAPEISEGSVLIHLK
ncbi:hypothetical protein VSR68_30000 [Paraburkholderia phymatum]|uniref:hypothetical protein n=1 Tax=Paraburkholderia phymatum TaxID=148447 RepID=UPI00316FDC1E